MTFGADTANRWTDPVGNDWWAILCLRWSKSVRRLLGTDLGSPSDIHAEKPNSSHDTLFQLAAWGIPAILTVIVLVARLVDADELFVTFAPVYDTSLDVVGQHSSPGAILSCTE
uniref:Frizzled/Smoothened 7TM domain-containing protein n=1 Tax=Anopheles minimus TaxID=112268 RepID=A0A182VU91_9DIPT